MINPGDEARPAAYLDRDGVINVNRGYVFRIKDLELTPTALVSIRLLNEARYRVIVVTNQSGVARGHAANGLIYDEFSRNLKVTRPARSLWPHTEAIKAALVRYSRNHRTPAVFAERWRKG